MNCHNSDDLIERFSMGQLQELDLADFEEHLLHCEQCQKAVDRTDDFVGAVRGAAEQLLQRERSASVLPVPTRSTGEYLLVEAALPNTPIENIGILLLDAESDRLYCRFRRDYEEFAGDEADWFKELPHAISERAHELGAQNCIEWMESTLSNTVRISARKIEDYETRLSGLYAKHIRSNVLPFRTHLPQYSLEAAAGKFGKQMDVEPEGWLEVRADIPLTDDMFVTHVKGHSMEPLIPDASLCAFRSKIDGSWDGKVLLIEHYGESGGNRYTVKRVHISENSDPNRQGDEAWLHQRLTLESINPTYKSWDVASAGKIRPLGEFIFVV